MTDSSVEHALADGLQFRSALARMSETELDCLLDIVELLEVEFQLTLLRESETAEALAAAQYLLKIWNSEVDQFLQDKQAMDTYMQLHIGDHEGGLVAPEDSQQDEDWENFEDTG